MATAPMLQVHDKVSDAEAQRRATVDLSWKVALGVDAYSRLFAQNTLQCFRAQLILHEKMQEVFVRSLDPARERGLLQGRALQAVLDTTPILSRGAAKDTYNLLADVIRQLMHRRGRWLLGPGRRAMPGTWSPVSKGEVQIDWADEGARTGLPAQVRAAQGDCAPDAPCGARSRTRSSSWVNCCCRMWNVRMRGYVSSKEWNKIASCRCMTPRCAMVARAATSALMVTRPPSQWSRKAS